MRQWLQVTLWILVIGFMYHRPILTQDFVAIPEMTSWAVDRTGTLSSEEQSTLHTKLEDFQKQKGSQIAVLIVPTTQPEPIEDFCLRVAEKWKVGRSGVDDGVILCVAKDDRKLRIEVGYGAEGAVPDARAKQIIEKVIVPNFKSELFYQGIKAGTDALILLLSGEDFTITGNEDEAESTGQVEEDSEGTFYGLILVFGVLAFIIHIAVPNDYLLKVGAGGSGVSFLVSVFLIGFFQSLLVAGGFFLITMFGMQILWLILSSSGRGGGSSSGFSSGGSFSGGGGGSFGGGGSSGSW